MSRAAEPSTAQGRSPRRQEPLWSKKGLYKGNAVEVGLQALFLKMIMPINFINNFYITYRNSVHGL